MIWLAAVAWRMQGSELSPPGDGNVGRPAIWDRKGAKGSRHKFPGAALTSPSPDTRRVSVSVAAQ
jgi:hypothetical protein